MIPSPGVSLTHSLLEHLGQAIVMGAYDATPFPTEADICTRNHTSRTVTREALKMLTAKGLLSARPRLGTKVEPLSRWNLLDPQVLRWLIRRPLTPELILEFNQVRLAFEPMAAQLAARHAGQGRDPVALQSIKQSLDLMIRHHNDRALSIRHDIEFHGHILEASGNPFYRQLRPLIDTALTLSISLTSLAREPSDSHNDHVRVYTLIEAGDGAAAEALMRDLITKAIAVIIEETPSLARRTS
jgi:DNA-binding FadR family transcriptional regulator